MIHLLISLRIPSARCGQNRAEEAWRFQGGRAQFQRPICQNHTSSASIHLVCTVCNCRFAKFPRGKEEGGCHTGNTMGTPPRTAFVPSSLALSLKNNLSLPCASFQLRIVAPYSSISTLSPVGSTALTLSSPTVTCACGATWPGLVESALGFFGRSTIIARV